MKLKSIIILGAAIVCSGALSGIRAYSQTVTIPKSFSVSAQWLTNQPTITTEMHYRWCYEGAPIIEEPTNSLFAVTNIVIGTNYTGTVQIGTNIWKMSELQKRKWFNKIIVPTYVYFIIVIIVLSGLYALSLFRCASKAGTKIEELRSAAVLKVNDSSPKYELHCAATLFATTRRSGADAREIQESATALDNAAFDYVITELYKSVHARK